MGDEATHALRARSFVGRSSREGAQWEVDTIAAASRRRTATNSRASHGLLWSGFVNRGEWAAPTAALSRSRKLAVDAHHHTPEGGAAPRTTAPRRRRVDE